MSSEKDMIITVFVEGEGVTPVRLTLLQDKVTFEIAAEAIPDDEVEQIVSSIANVVYAKLTAFVVQRAEEYIERATIQ